MSMSEDAALAREATSLKAIVVGGLLTIGGAIIAGVSTFIPIQWLHDTILAFATTLISTGALALLFELGLRRSVHREMLRIVSIKTNLMASQIVAAGKQDELDVQSVLRHRTNYDLLMSDPARWIDKYFFLMMESGAQQRIEVTCYVLDPKSKYLDAAARYLQQDPSNFSISLQSALSVIEGRWKARRQVNSLFKGSKISIRLLEEPPFQTIILADDKTIMTVQGALGKHDADLDFALVYAGNRNQFPSAWFAAQVERLGKSAIHFQDEIGK